MTKRKHQRYDLEFKRQAVVLANHPDIMTQDVAQSLNIHPFMLSRWKKEMREGKLMGQTQDGESSTNLVKANQLIRDLEREVKRLKEENAVLKAAERFFSSKKKTSSSS